jgi:hypothetical protein
VLFLDAIIHAIGQGSLVFDVKGDAADISGGTRGENPPTGHLMQPGVEAVSGPEFGAFWFLTVLGHELNHDGLVANVFHAEPSILYVPGLCQRALLKMRHPLGSRGRVRIKRNQKNKERYGSKLHWFLLRLDREKSEFGWNPALIRSL